MIKFNHSENDIELAIGGCKMDEVKDILKEIAKDPNDYIGNTVSETAEFILEHSSDPNMLFIITKGFLAGVMGDEI